jgi:transcriptional regulator with XRE-family HTH domain
MNQFGDRLKKLRLDKNLTLDQVAKDTETSAPYLSNLENGKNDNPSAATIIKIVGYFETSADYLMLGKEEVIKRSVYGRLEDFEKKFIAEYVEFCLKRKV